MAIAGLASIEFMEDPKPYPVPLEQLFREPGEIFQITVSARQVIITTRHGLRIYKREDYDEFRRKNP